MAHRRVVEVERRPGFMREEEHDASYFYAWGIVMRMEGQRCFGVFEAWSLFPGFKDKR